MGDPQNPGIIPLAIFTLFDQKIEAEKQQNCSVELTLSYIEIYNEQVRDLLDDGKQVDIATDRDKGVIIKDVTETICDKEE